MSRQERTVATLAQKFYNVRERSGKNLKRWLLKEGSPPLAWRSRAPAETRCFWLAPFICFARRLPYASSTPFLLSVGPCHELSNDAALNSPRPRTRGRSIIWGAGSKVRDDRIRSRAAGRRGTSVIGYDHGAGNSRSTRTCRAGCATMGRAVIDDPRRAAHRHRHGSHIGADIGCGSCGSERQQVITSCRTAEDNPRGCHRNSRADAVCGETRHSGRAGYVGRVGCQHTHQRAGCLCREGAVVGFISCSHARCYRQWPYR